MNNEILELSVEEMDLIYNIFNTIFPNREYTIFHQKESYIAHIDLGVLYNANSSIIFTMGMSNFIMEDGTSCEVFVEVPNEMFKIPPTKNNCGGNIADLLNLNYSFILTDLQNIALMPSDGALYKSGETLSTGGRIYGLFEFFRKENPYKKSTIKYMYLPQLTNLDLQKLQGKNLDEREKYFSKLIEPVKIQ